LGLDLIGIDLIVSKPRYKEKRAGKMVLHFTSHFFTRNKNQDFIFYADKSNGEKHFCNSKKIKLLLSFAESETFDFYNFATWKNRRP
jgi:hypothetical protein